MQVKFFLKNRIFLALIFNSVSYAASQAISIGDKRFQTPRHSFSNEEVWDFDDKTFKQINGTNYYGVFKQGLISDITLEVFNPKQSLQGAKLEILLLIIPQKKSWKCKVCMLLTLWIKTCIL